MNDLKRALPDCNIRHSQPRLSGVMHTLRLPLVQKELDLSDKQKQKIDQLIEKAAKIAGADKPVAPGSESSGTGGLGKSQTMQLNSLSRVLKPQQIKRLKEVGPASAGS